MGFVLQTAFSGYGFGGGTLLMRLNESIKLKVLLLGARDECAKGGGENGWEVAFD